LKLTVYSLFNDHPETRALIARVNGANIYSTEFKAHAERVFGTLGMTIGLLDDNDAFDAQMARIKEQHNQRGVTGQHFLVNINSF
jgi:Globin